ncbi:MAG: hypothetical protein WCH84_10785, partial [Verrucomicrobiota bacterium]
YHPTEIKKTLRKVSTSKITLSFPRKKTPEDLTSGSFLVFTAEQCWLLLHYFIIIDSYLRGYSDKIDA